MGGPPALSDAVAAPGSDSGPGRVTGAASHVRVGRRQKGICVIDCLMSTTAMASMAIRPVPQEKPA